MPLSTAEESQLQALRTSLLKGRPRVLSPDEGDEALQQHALLATTVHRATLLQQTGNESQTNAWIRFFEEHFPDGRNDPANARLLFDDWRTSLLKDGGPGPEVAVAHAKPHLHWQRDEHLCINLEDMWDDFEYAVAGFIEGLKSNHDRRAVVLDRWRRQEWEVRDFGAVAGASVAGSANSVSVVKPR